MILEVLGVNLSLEVKGPRRKDDINYKMDKTVCTSYSLSLSFIS